ncbi:hypothetical protein QNZ74_004476 [Vibrio parahaemolyticus]|nr:hypothetical protein [Vibrio parahaemolyticus]
MINLEPGEITGDEKRVEQAVKNRMTRYQLLERRVSILYILTVTLSVTLMVIGLIYPIAHYLGLINYFSKPMSYYYGYLPILASIFLFLINKEFFSKWKRIELNILNNHISSYYDDYLMKNISLWELKTGVDELIDFYVKNSKNVFLVKSRY